MHPSHESTRGQGCHGRARVRLRVAAAAAACATAFPGAADVPLRHTLTGSHGVVAAGRSHTANAGARVMAAGGNAIDAGVAALFAAAVVEISHFGLGGEAPILIYSARDRAVAVLNGQGPAPRAATPALFAGQSALPANGPLAATIPAVVDAAALALARYGTLSLGDVLAPAIELADGFPMYEFLRRHLESERAGCEPYEWTMRTYYPGGRIPDPGESFRQPNLARTLRTIAEAEAAAQTRGVSRGEAIRAGRDAFYRGEIARRIVAANRAAGGMFSEDDLSRYEGRIEQPYSVGYRGYQVFKGGPWNQGPVLLQTLQLLEGFELGAMGPHSPEAIHTMAEAVKLAYADRDRFYADPDFVGVPMTGLLSPEYARERRRLIDPLHASVEQRPGNPTPFERPVISNPVAPKAPAPSILRVDAPGDSHSVTPAGRTESGDTTAIEVADAAGNLFSATPSSGWLLGGAFVAGDTGVPLSNRMQAFRLDPSSPNVLAGGKRPRTSLTPTVLLRSGRPWLAIGTPGGDSQDQQILQVLLNLIDFGMDLQTAIEAPRVNSLHPESSFAEHKSEPGVLEVETSLADSVLAALEARGHLLRRRPPYGISTGVVAAGVDTVGGKLRGGADPRRERYVVAW